MLHLQIQLLTKLETSCIHAPYRNHAHSPNMSPPFHQQIVVFWQIITPFALQITHMERQGLTYIKYKALLDLKGFTAGQPGLKKAEMRGHACFTLDTSITPVAHQ